MPGKNLHVCIMENKFIPSFMDFIEKNLDISQHEFIVFGNINKCPINIRQNTFIAKKGKFNQLFAYARLIARMHTAKRIILHSLFNLRIVKILFFMPWLLRKCCWVMWGGDFYFPEKQSWLKKQVIKKCIINQ